MHRETTSNPLWYFRQKASPWTLKCGHKLVRVTNIMECKHPNWFLFKSLLSDIGDDTVTQCALILAIIIIPCSMNYCQTPDKP